jgi:hypothetical protein
MAWNRHAIAQTQLWKHVASMAWGARNLIPHSRELRAARHVAIEADLGAAEVLPVFRHRYQLPERRVELDDVRKEFRGVLRIRLIHTLDGARQPAEAAAQRAHHPV